MKLKEIAEILKGELYGDGDIEIFGVSDVANAGHGQICYVTSPSKKDLRCKASALIVNKQVDLSIPQIVVKNPKYAFATLLALFYPKRHPFSGISKRAEIAEDVVLGEGVSVGAFAVISSGVKIGANSVLYPNVFVGSNVTIGRDCIIYSNVSIMEDSIIGDRVVIHPGAVVGSDGFGFVTEDGAHKKIPQVGNVAIGDDVEIGANTTIDRATIGTTKVGRGTKIDNLVQIGHNVTIGENTIIVAQVGIGGSSVIGNSVILAGQAGVSDHATIEAGSIIGAKSGVTGRLSKDIYIGTPARPFRQVSRAYENLHILPELKDRIERLERLVDRCETNKSK